MERRRVEWAQLVGQAALIILLIAVPIVLNTSSNNVCDVKDIVLGLGVAVGLGLWLLASLAKGEASWPRSRLNALVAALLIWSAISLSYARYRYVTVSELGRLASNVAVFWLAILCLRQLAQVRRVLGWVAIGSIPMLAYGFYQKSGRDFIPWSNPVERVFSFLGNPTYFGGYLMLLIPVMVACGVLYLMPNREGERPRSRWSLAAAAAFFLLAVVMLICLYWSVTLSGMIGLLLSLTMAFVLVLVRGGRRAARVAVPAAALAMVALLPLAYLGYNHLDRAQQRRVQQVLSLRDPYGKERQLHWRTALGIFRERPLIGEGYGAFRVYAMEKMAPEWYAQAGRRADTMLVPGYAHNEYLQELADLGLVGGVLFLALVLGALGLAVRLAVKHPDGRWAVLCLGVSAAMTAFLFQNFFGVTFRQAGAVTFYWLWLGLLVLASASMPRPGGEQQGLDLKVLRFPRLSAWKLASVAAPLAAVWWFLLWPVSVNPMLASMDVRLAKRLAGQGQYREGALLADRAVSLCPYSFMGYYTSGFAWGATGEFEKAIEANRKALALMPGNASVYYNLGVAYKEKGDLGQALTSFRRAVELMPTSYKHQAAMAETLTKQGKPNEAVPFAQKAAKLARGTKDEGSCYLLLASIYNQMGRSGELLATVQQAVEMAPRDPKLRQQLALLYFRAGDKEKGAQAVRDWIRLEPGSAMAHNSLGTYYFGKQQYLQAKQEFEQALATDPADPVARFNLGLCLGRLGDMAASLAQFRQLAEESPNTTEGKRARKLMDQIAQQRQRSARQR